MIRTPNLKQFEKDEVSENKSDASSIDYGDIIQQVGDVLDCNDEEEEEEE